MKNLTVSEIKGTDLKVGNTWYHISQDGNWQAIRKPVARQISIPEPAAIQSKKSFTKALIIGLTILSVLLACRIFIPSKYDQPPHAAAVTHKHHKA
jgi:hypothetical protein